MKARLPSRDRLALLAVTLAATVAVASALELWWTSDDAFIVARYARNFVDGNGLVFNAGEHVEGYTDFLWVVWTGVGLWLRSPVELWMNLSGIACAVGTIVLLGRAHRALRDAAGARAMPVPVSALAAAASPHLGQFATGGLETAAFIVAAVGATTWLMVGPRTPRRLLVGGALFGVAALIRADGPVFAVAAGAWVLCFSRPRWRGVVAYVAGFVAVFGPFLVWRVVTYGDLLPNTYYFKSGGAAWWGQGWHYLVLFLAQYWAIALVVPLVALLAWSRRRAGLDELTTIALLPAFAGLAYVLYVVRLGGDFMYARMLLPAVPLLLLASEAALLRASTNGLRGLAYGVAAIIVLAPVVTGAPDLETRWSHGVADERAYYLHTDKADEGDAQGAEMKATLAGLPVTLATFGSEARLAFRSEIPTVIDGLTDRVIARQSLAVRGRPGHEKLAAPDYLVDVRRVDFVMTTAAFQQTGLDAYVPAWQVRLGPHTHPYLVHWDAPLVDALRRRGVTVDDFPAFLDRYLAGIDAVPDTVLRADHDKFRHFYFQFVIDPAREAPFLARLPTP